MTTENPSASPAESHGSSFLYSPDDISNAVVKMMQVKRKYAFLGAFFRVEGLGLRLKGLGFRL